MGMAAQNSTRPADAAPPSGAPRGPVARALRLIEAVDRRAHGSTPTELADEVGLPIEAARRLLRTLEREGYLQRLDDGAYVVGSALALLGEGSRELMVQSRLLAKLSSLRDELGAAVYFSRYQDGEVSVDVVVDSPSTPSVHEWVDFRATGHASALGKCLLGQLDHDGRRDHFFRHPAARFTARTEVDQTVLLHLLDRQPATVPVLDLQEYALGTVCAAVPITAGGSVGALGFSLPLDQSFRLRETAETLASRAAPVLLALAL